MKFMELDIQRFASFIYDIQYNANGGTGELGPQESHDETDVIYTNTFTRTGYTFSGWNTAADGTGDDIPVDSTTGYVSSIVGGGFATLYAQWTVDVEKYVTLENLRRYDGRIKNYIGNIDVGNVHVLPSGIGVSSGSPFIFENYKPGIYFLTPSSTSVSSNIYAKGLSSATSYISISGCGSAYINYFKDINEANTNEIIARVYSTLVSSSTAADSKVVEIKKSTAAAKIATGNTSSYSLSTSSMVKTTGTQTITGTKTFSVLPESSVVPTSNDQLTNKKYVDDAIAAGSGTLSNYLILTSNFDVYYTSYRPGDYLINLNGHKLVISHQDPSGEVTITDDLVNVPDDYVFLKIHSTSSDYSLCSFIQNDGNVQIVYDSGAYSEYQYEIIEVNSNMVKTAGNQTISGIKTFDVLPRSSVTPTLDNQLVNKAYVDETAASIQVSALPSADSSNLDKIYQYIGATNSIYTNGYFYKCLYDGDDYYWENIPVQASATTNSFVPTLLSSLLNNNTLNVYDLYSSGSSKAIIRDSEAFSVILGYKAIGWNDPYTVSSITSGGMFYVKTDLDNGLVYVYGLVNNTGATVDYKVKISDTDTIESVMASSNGGSYDYLYSTGGAN